MKEPRYGPFVVVGGIGIALAWGLYYFAESMFEPTIKEAHTAAVIGELRQIVAGDDLPSFIEAVSDAEIDWNSCRLEGGLIYDGWGVPLEVRRDVENGGWSFRSAGDDGRFGTRDDIVPSP